MSPVLRDFLPALVAHSPVHQEVRKQNLRYHQQGSDLRRIGLARFQKLTVRHQTSCQRWSRHKLQRRPDEVHHEALRAVIIRQSIRRAVCAGRADFIRRQLQLGNVRSALSITSTDNNQNLTSKAPVILFSLVRRSGLQPGTRELGAPIFPPGGVTPPEPLKYGTFAARWLYSRR